MTARIVLLSTADTELLAAAGAVERLPAGAPELRAHNPSRAGDDLGAWVAEVTAGADVVVTRLLGGEQRFGELIGHLEARCAATGTALLAFGGEADPDAQLAERSTVAPGVLAEAFEYLRLGGVDNAAALVRHLGDTLLGTEVGVVAPVELPEHGAWHPEVGAPGADGADAAALARLSGQRPAVGVVVYRSHLLSGNTDFVAALLDALEARGCDAVALHCYSLRPDGDGRVPLLAWLEDEGVALDALVTTVLAMGGSSAAPRSGASTRADQTASDADGWSAPALEALGVPVVQALTVTASREEWLASDAGLSPLDAAMQVALPEFDGRVVTVPVSFKEELEGASPVGGALVRYAPDLERTGRAAGIAANLARLRHVPAGDKRIALVLSNYPTKHSRVGNGVGLDTPASVVALLRGLHAAGVDLGAIDERYLADPTPGASGDAQSPGDALIHDLIAAGGFDEEFLTDEQLERADARLSADDYVAWFATLPEDLREAVVAQWGPPPGEVLLTPDGRELVIATMRFGNVVLAIQPPRGFGDDTIAIYHDPDLPPTHHYLAAYRWLAADFGADAIVHVGKHGTLEWLPGKGLGMSASCATDAALSDVPLIYPFVVNDPGEGTQAKRRAHAIVVDHLVPPMQRAETYDDIARLEQLLDEYAEIEALDPTKLPAIRDRVWDLMVSSEVTSSLGIDGMPEDLDEFGELITHVDGYLCEVKDIQIRDGLHVLGAVPADEQLTGLLAAILRLPQGEVPGLRAVVAAAFGIDEAALLADPGARADQAAASGWPAPDFDGLSARVDGPAVSRGDVLDLVDALARRVLDGLAERGWDADTAEDVVAATLGAPDPDVVEVARFACDEVVPRIRACEIETDRVLDALWGRYIPSGPSGSPTRGRLDVLPTGRNFHSVDPKGLPSPISWEVGQRLADDLVRHHLEEEGELPETVGIVVWGTAAMRTHGDDVAEILALLGVRPTWHDETRRVTGIEVIDLAELGRPRIDVTVRISGFFRDAFPHLVRLLDDAFTTVAALDEPDEDNLVARHAREQQAALEADGVAPAEARRRATTRIFGAKPGAYGSGLLPLIDSREWKDVHDLAEVYTVWSGHAYGRGLDGVEARDDMRAAFSRIRVAVKNADTREHDLLDSDDYFQEHGGMVATVRSLTGAAPRSVIGDSSDPSRPSNRGLDREVDRIVRARVVNPRWIDGMRRHGYKGAFELSATVDYLFGYDATAGVVADWQYQRVTRAYLGDDEVRDFLKTSNPWAMKAIAERLLEAVDRGLWAQPDDEDLDLLRDAFLEADGDLEGRDEEPAGDTGRPVGGHPGGGA